jgi:hypothetical protein
MPRSRQSDIERLLTSVEEMPLERAKACVEMLSLALRRRETTITGLAEAPLSTAKPLGKAKKPHRRVRPLPPQTLPAGE